MPVAPDGVQDAPDDGDAEEPVYRREPVEELRCAYHPNRPTMVSCSDCGKPLCPDCMVYAAVGIKCRECARMPRSARVNLTANRWVRAIAAGLGAGTAVGFAYYYLLGSVGFFFFVFFVAAGIGYLVGEAVAARQRPLPWMGDRDHRGRRDALGLPVTPVSGERHPLWSELERGGIQPLRPGRHQLGDHGYRRVPGVLPQPLRARSAGYSAVRERLALSTCECQP